MKSTKIFDVRVVAVLTGMMVAALAYADAQRSVAEPVAPLADRASRVEGQVARTNLVGRLEAALGTEYAGAWFDAATAEVHVGVPSPSSRRDAEAVATQAGLAEAVVATPVRWAWPQLQAAQQRWNRRLAGLFARGEVMTSISARANAVEVELGSNVPAAERRALEDEAAEAAVDIRVVALPGPLREGTHFNRCKAFAPDKAYCDPTIVAGVRIEKESGASCTAGPPALTKSPASKEQATGTYVLTAGHCVEGTGKWYAINKSGPPGGKKELGAGSEFLNGKIDVGAIDVSTTYWANAKDPPVKPAIAVWGEADHDPIPIEQQSAPLEEARACFSGQRSGNQCGEVTHTETTYKFLGEPVTTEKLVRVLLENGGKAGPGDSGAPFYDPNAPSTVYGTLVGGELELGQQETEKVLFHKLKTSFAELEAQKKLSLELLTVAKEWRHPAAKAGAYPVTFHGGISSAVERFITEAGNVDCKKTSHHGVMSAATSVLADTPKYEECTAFGFVGATVNMEGCFYEFYAFEKTSTDNYKSSLALACPEGQSVKIAGGTCKAEIKPQLSLTTTDFINDTAASPKKDITVRPTVTGLAYTVTQDGFGCAFNGVGAKTGGQYTSTANLTITGQSTTNATEKIDIEVGG